MYYMALYRTIKKVHRKIAMPTFNGCIKDLTVKGLIAKADVKGRGIKIDYFLTNKGKQRVKFLLQVNENEENDKSIECKEKLRSVYLVILFLFRQEHTYTIGSERKFNDFLSKNNLSSREMIQLPKNEENKMGNIVTTTVFRHRSGIRISKIETPNSNDEGTVYKCSLPGLSVTDVLLSDNTPIFRHIKFTESDVQEAFDLLHDEGIIKKILITHDGNLRYIISDPLMENLLEYCGELYHLVYTVIEVIWEIRKPIAEEIKWIEQAIGSSGAVKMTRKSNGVRTNRLKKAKNKKQILAKATQKILEYRNMIKHDVLLLRKDYAEQIEKYQFLCDELFQIIYPKFLQQLSFRK
jgi:hypothetical protein